MPVQVVGMRVDRGTLASGGNPIADNNKDIKVTAGSGSMGMVALGKWNSRNSNS